MGLAWVWTACGGGGAPASTAAPSPAATSAEPTVSNVVRTRLPKDTPCGTDDVCGYFLQVISPGAEPEQLTKRALDLVRGKCAGAIIVYRDKRGVMGAGPVFSSEQEKTACREALGRAPETDDYPSAAVWRKAD